MLGFCIISYDERTHQDRQQNPRMSHCLISSGNIKLINQLRFVLTEPVHFPSSGNISIPYNVVVVELIGILLPYTGQREQPFVTFDIALAVFTTTTFPLR